MVTPLCEIATEMSTYCYLYIMGTKRNKKTIELTLEEKYERWAAFASACHQFRFDIAAGLWNVQKAARKKKVAVALAEK
jgi:hypothetical protein